MLVSKHHRIVCGSVIHTPPLMLTLQLVDVILSEDFDALFMCVFKSSVEFQVE